MKRLAADALRVLLGLALGLLVAEVAARAWLEWLPQPKAGTYLRDPVIGYRLRPQPARGDTAGNPYHVNALGFRDHEHAPTKGARVRRVIGIGDSFVAGEVPLEDNFLRVAERRWNERIPGRPISGPDSVEIFLMGLGGYGPEQYLGTLRSVGLATAPDLVLLCFYVGNDVTGVATRHAVRRGELYSTGSSDPRLNLLRESHLFAWLEKRLVFGLRRGRARERRAAEAAGNPPSATPMPLTRLYLEVLRNRLPFYAARPSAPVERLWTEALGCLDAFDQACREAGVPWALVIIPDEFQVDPVVREEALRRLGARGEDLDVDGPSRRLAAWATDRGVAAIDLLPLFREQNARRGSLYIPSDTHWNKIGNLVAGEAVARFADSMPGWRSRPTGGPAATPAVRTGGVRP